MHLLRGSSFKCRGHRGQCNCPACTHSARALSHFLSHCNRECDNVFQLSHSLSHRLQRQAPLQRQECSRFQLRHGHDAHGPIRHNSWHFPELNLPWRRSSYPSHWLSYPHCLLSIQTHFPALPDYQAQIEALTEHQTKSRGRNWGSCSGRLRVKSPGWWWDQTRFKTCVDWLQSRRRDYKCARNQRTLLRAEEKSQLAQTEYFFWLRTTQESRRL